MWVVTVSPLYTQGLVHVARYSVSTLHIRITACGFLLCLHVTFHDYFMRLVAVSSIYISRLLQGVST